MLLAGDVGGTKTLLALFETDGPRLRQLVTERYHSHEYAGLEPIVAAFRKQHGGTIEVAAIGIAGPVRQGRVVTPNLPWEVDAAHLADELRIDHVALINDLEANAHGLRALGPDDYAVLNSGAPDGGGNAALISAGTGLGEAGLFWDGRRHIPFASEGGHCDFAPLGPRQIELAEFLTKQFGHVSYERVLSGAGLQSLYHFLLAKSGKGDDLPALLEKYKLDDPAAAITQAALHGTSALCRQAVELFVAIYGAEAGNLALKVLATGGVFIGGGIAPKILTLLREPAFVQAFCDKGRMRPLLEAMPVRVILNEQTALLGAARHAADLRDERGRTA